MEQLNTALERAIELIQDHNERLTDMIMDMREATAKLQDILREKELLQEALRLTSEKN